MVNDNISKSECEAALDKPGYPKALQSALADELTKLIQTNFDDTYTTAKLNPSIRCGSLIMEAVVGTFAKQVRLYTPKHPPHLFQRLIPVSPPDNTVFT